MRGLLTLAVAALATVALAACGDIDSGKVEDSIRSGLEKELDQQGGNITLESVDCPDGQQSETGHTFECTAEDSEGNTATIEAEVTDGDNGDVTWNVTETNAG